MAYDQLLADRVRNVLQNEKLTEKDMFDGIGFLWKDTLVCGVQDEFLIVNVGVDRFKEVLTHPQVRPFRVDGRTMSGCVMVKPLSTAREADLKGWIQSAMDFVKSQPN